MSEESYDAVLGSKMIDRDVRCPWCVNNSCPWLLELFMVCQIAFHDNLSMQLELTVVTRAYRGD